MPTGELGRKDLRDRVDRVIKTYLCLFAGPTLKVKRNVVNKMYADVIDKFYQ